jgi:phage terminase large subunit GpA-like protein
MATVIRRRSRRGLKGRGSGKRASAKPTTVSSAQAGEVIREWLEIFRPRELLKPSVWQERYRLSPPGSPKPGKWRNYPFQVEMFDSFDDEGIASLTLMLASQVLGKTSIVEGGIMWAIDQNPGSMVAVFPTHENAGHWSKNRLGAQIARCPVIRDNVEQTGAGRLTRIGSGRNTVLHKRFKGGWLVMGGANSPAGLAAHTARWQVFEEVDRYPESAGEEGDVIILTQQRGAKFPDSFSVITSTPTLADMSRIEKEFESTDQRKWFVKCEGCASEFVILWHHITWPKEESPTGERIHRIEAAGVECPFCKRVHDEAARIRMVESGRWIATQPHVKVKRGYWANAFIALGPHPRGYRSWLHYFCQRFFDAERLGIEGKKTFVNLILGEPYQLETLPPPDYQRLYERREFYPEFETELVIPDKVCLLTVGADVQFDRIECEIVGFGLAEETWGIAYRIFKGDTELPEIYAALDEWVRHKWKHASGHYIWPAAVAIDSSNKPAAPYDYVLRCRREYVYAVKGRRGYESHWVQRSGTRKPLMILAVDGPKERLYSQLKLTEYGPGYQHFPANPSAGYDLEYFQQLTSERMVKGTAAPYFVNINRRPNEALDARIYALAAREFLPGVNYQKIQANFQIPAENDWRPGAKEARIAALAAIPTPPEPSPVPPNQRTPLPERSPRRPNVRRSFTGWSHAY